MHQRRDILKMFGVSRIIQHTEVLEGPRVFRIQQHTEEWNVVASGGADFFGG